MQKLSQRQSVKNDKKLQNKNDNTLKGNRLLLEKYESNGIDGLYQSKIQGVALSFVIISHHMFKYYNNKCPQYIKVVPDFVMICDMIIIALKLMNDVYRNENRIKINDTKINHIMSEKDSYKELEQYDLNNGKLDDKNIQEYLKQCAKSAFFMCVYFLPICNFGNVIVSGDKNQHCDYKDAFINNDIVSILAVFTYAFLNFKQISNQVLQLSESVLNITKKACQFFQSDVVVDKINNFLPRISEILTNQFKSVDDILIQDLTKYRKTLPLKIKDGVVLSQHGDDKTKLKTFEYFGINKNDCLKR